MGNQGRWRRVGAWGWLALLLSSGCCYLHPIHALPPEAAAPCQSLPRCCKDHVHIFLINGLDPLNYGNLSGLRDAIQALGFHQTYYGQLYHYWWFQNQIRRIQHADPEAHFVLIGFSVGVNLVDVLARSLQREGVYVDVLVFLSGNQPLIPIPSRPSPNVGRVVNILAGGWLRTWGDRDWAENLRLLDGDHFSTPTHQGTLETLVEVLTQVAATVPEVLPAFPDPASTEFQAPTPRPVKPQDSTKGDEWDFLKPVSRRRVRSSE